MSLFYEERADGSVLIRVKAVPGASRDEIAGVLGDRLKIRVSAPAEGGKANKAIVKLLADVIEIKAAEVVLESGASSAQKVFRVLDCDPLRVHRLGE